MHISGLTKFADMPKAVMDRMNGGKVPKAWLQKMQKLNRRRRGKVALAGFDDLPSPPQSLDWRDKDGDNFVTPAKNQGNCGDCYAFASVSNKSFGLCIVYNLHNTIAYLLLLVLKLFAI